MADSIILSDGTNDYEFVYDSSTQNDFKVHYGVRAEAGEPDPLWHRPDGASPKLIRLKNQPRTVFLTQNVYGDDWNDVINTLAPIKRLVDGEDQQAARYHTHGDVSKVYLRIQLDGMTNYTDATVIYGDVDDSGSFYTPAAILNKRALGVVVMLVVEPLGEGAAVSMRNDCPSSPHFLEDSDANGLADGYTSFGSPTTGLNHGKGLTGGKSQGITTGASSGVGFNMTNYVTAATSDPYVAYAWLSVNNTNNDIITITVQGASSTTLAQKSFDPTNPSGYDKVITGPDGNTWYRYSFSDDGSPARAAANLRLRIGRESANATKATTFYVDNLFIMVGTTTIPDAWCSTSAIQNRNDPTSASAATEARINYVDVWGVPGDSDAVTQTVVELGAVTRSTIIASRHTDGAILAANIDHWIESDEFTTTSASGTWSTGTGTSDNHYQRFTEGGSPGTNSRAYILLTGSSARALLKYPRRIFSISRSSSLLSQFVCAVATAGAYITEKTNSSTTGTAVQTVNTWELIDLGLLQGAGVLPDSVPTDADQEVSLSVHIQSAPSSSTNDIDALFIPVVGDEFAVWVGKENTKSSGGEILFNGVTRRVVSEGSGINEDPAGALWYTAPQKMNRYIFAVVGSSGANTLADTMAISFTIYPRTRHLLGTS